MKDHQAPLPCAQMATADPLQSPLTLLISPLPAAQAVGKARVAEGCSCCEPQECHQRILMQIKEKSYFSLDLPLKTSVALKHYTSSVFRVGRGSRD